MEIWRLTTGAIPGAWVDERDGAAAVVTGIPGWGRNGVWTTRRDVAPEILDELLGRVAEADVPHSLQLREGAPAELIGIARRHGLVFDADEPVMVLDDPAPLASFAGVDGFAVRRLGPHEGALHARVAAPSFDERVEVFEAAASPEILSVPGIRCFAGEAGGEVVSTAMAVTHLGVTAVFGVATSPPHRGRGYGAAVTAHALLDGFGAGAGWAWLQADPDATSLYERLGFRAVETCAIWVHE
ncbi:MAG TPA: GNAT family N-acetyltransferase [Actinomycetota bacterium]|nr:GNAT family N-acetyltransferase [Actinomycetota bacterium]